MYWPLPKASHKVMKTILRDMKLLIVDEVSMVSSLTLAYIHLRLEEIFAEQDWFGSKNVLFVGDLLQFQLVNGQPVFEKVSSKAVALKLGCGISVNIWRLSTTSSPSMSGSQTTSSSPRCWIACSAAIQLTTL